MSNNPLLTIQKRSSSIRKLELTRGKGRRESVSLIAILKFSEFVTKPKLLLVVEDGLSICLVATQHVMLPLFNHALTCPDSR